MFRNSWVAERLTAFQGLISVELELFVTCVCGGYVCIYSVIVCHSVNKNAVVIKWHLWISTSDPLLTIQTLPCSDISGVICENWSCRPTIRKHSVTEVCSVQWVAIYPFLSSPSKTSPALPPAHRCSPTPTWRGKPSHCCSYSVMPAGQANTCMWRG
jgi:hypothetical protein